MLIWIGALSLLIITILLFSFIKVEVILKVRDDVNFQGISMQIDSRFYKQERNYDYTDPKLSLIESLIISTLENRINGQNSLLNDYHEETLQTITSLIVKDIFRLSTVNYDMFKIVLGHITVNKLEWKTTVGFQDAFHTAISTGVFWAIKGTFISMLSSKCHLNNLVVDVRPNFTNPIFLSSFICIFKIRTVHIIIMSMRLKVRWWINGYTARKSSTSN